MDRIVSVIVPVYNVQATLDRCVRSILDQNVRDMEVILVDDGSPDASSRMCDDWATRDSRIIVIHQENGGLSAARNAGLAVATGRYVTFVDSDDYVESGTYQGCLDYLAHNQDVDILEYPAIVHQGAGRRQQNLTFTTHRTSCHDLIQKQQCWLDGMFTHCYMWNKLFRRSLFEDIVFSVGQIFEDVRIMPLILDRTNLYAVISTGLYHYVDNPQGICMSGLGEKNVSLIEAQLQALEHLGLDLRDRSTDRVMASLINTQIDVWRYSQQRPRQMLLPQRWVSLWGADNTVMRLKLLIHNLFGLRFLCELYRFVYLWQR